VDNMSGDEVEFIKKEIEKTGFPLEIEISSILKKGGWNVMHSSPYLDEDEGKWREINIKAYKSMDERSDGKSIKPFRLTIALIIECKKSEESAWILFPRTRSKEEIKRATNIRSLDFLTVVKRQSLLKGEFVYRDRFTSPLETQFLDIDPSLIREEAMVTPEIARSMKFLSELEIIPPEIFRCLVKQTKAIAFTEIKLKKKKVKSHTSEIFEAINALIKATKYDLILASNGIHAGAYLMKWKDEKGAFQIDIFLPILIFDGGLYSWCDGNVKVEDEILLEGRCHTKHYFENMLIDIIKKERFETFLNEMKEDFLKLVDQVSENRRKLDEQVKMIMESQWFTGPGPSIH